MVCLKCQLEKSLILALDKVDEWEGLKCIQNTYRIRVQQLENEILTLACICESETL